MSKLEMPASYCAVNNAFGGMRYGVAARFVKLEKEDSAEVAMNKIGENLERLAAVLVDASDKASANERTLDDHKNMFRALGGMMAEVAKHTAPAN